MGVVDKFGQNLFWGKDSDEKLENYNGIFSTKVSKANIYISIQIQILEQNKNVYGNIFIPSKSYWAIGPVK